MLRIDLSSDLCEGYGPWAMSGIVSSANIACGGHAGDPETMYRTLDLARKNNVAVGAHPGFNEREGFGRRDIPMTPDAIGWMCAAQIGALIAVAAQVGVRVAYVKPHGALANLAAHDRHVADAIVTAVQNIDPTLAILAISGTQSEHTARAKNAPVVSEFFADLGYLASGQLVPRS